MENALLVGLSRLVALERQFDVVANNIANLNTTGFKSSSSIFQEYLGSGAQENAFAPNDAGVRFVLDRASLLDLRQGRSSRPAIRSTSRSMAMPSSRSRPPPANATRAAAHSRSIPPA